MPTQNQIREQITQQIVEHLTAGKVAPWRRPWSLDRNAGAPANVVSKKSYRGINPLLLQVAAMRHGFRSKWWATWNQWKALGGSVIRRPDDVPPGKWGTTIVFWSRITKTKSDDDEEESYFLLKCYTVFCIDQTDEDRDELLSRLVHESIDQHDYVIRDDLQILTLQFSKHPCASFFNGTLVGHHYQPGDNFPFAAFAADAFSADVAHKIKQLLDEGD